MKKILFAAFAASLLAAGCQKTEVYQPANSGEKMTFSTEMKKITKADGDGTTDETEEPDNQGTTTPTTPTGPYPDATGDHNLQAQGFNIWAYADYTEASTANNVDSKGIFDGMENWYVGHNGTWSPNKEFYWPGKGKKLHFFAISGSKKNTPEQGSANLKPANYSVTITPCFTENTALNKTDKTAPEMEITYTIPDSADDDLMVADFVTQDQDSKKNSTASSGRVDLNFHHTLSKVQFVFKTIASGPAVYVQKLTVTGLNNSGTLLVKAKSNGASTADETNVPVITEVEPKWSAQSGTKEYKVESKNAVQFENGETIDYVMNGTTKEYESNKGDRLTENSASEPLVTWLMMPQTITETSQIEVFYLIKNRQFKAVFPLKHDNATAWEENKFTKYTITLSPNLITFDAKSNPWDENTPSVDHQN